MTELGGLVSYTGAGVILAQVRIPWHSLELAWEKDATVKTVALEVPGRGSKQLVDDLRMAANARQPVCGVQIAGK